MATMIRYLVRRSSKDVWIWTEQLAARGDLEEVWAENPDSAVNKDAMPDPKRISIEQIERMGKADIIIFAETKLGQKVDPSLSKAQLQDLVKELIFTREAPEEQAPETAVPPTEKLDKPRGKRP